ncbi:hypothetical protein [Microvirga soli]|uniref:hypothetical protein n=1 Tax=Microvirga soli TaxID=1854496 RepID=UPI00191EBD3D|nr:hypothetical protein [Microvirga soli]
MKKSLFNVVQAAMRHTANRLLVRNFNLPFRPQSATLIVRAGKLPSRTDGPEINRICRDLSNSRHNERDMPHHLAAS